MVRRGVGWLAAALGVPLLAFGAVAATAAARGRSASFGDVVGSGDGLLLALAWYAVGFALLVSAPPRRLGVRTALASTGTSAGALALAAWVAVGIGGAGTGLTAVITTVDLVCAAVFVAVAAATGRGPGS